MNKKDDGKKEMEPYKSGKMVPPGFRFHPTDEELIDFYLMKKVTTTKFELDHVISEVDLNKLEPWDLHEKCKVDHAAHQTEWYFFSHKDKKYPTGTRTNRATKAGFWKATGRDKAVFSSTLLQPNCLLAGRRIGMRKTLVFYKGRAPHGVKTDWIMHEYRLHDSDRRSHQRPPSKVLANEDGWVVCRVFKKKNYEEKTSTSASSYYDNANLSDEDQAPDKSTHSTISIVPDMGSSQSIMSFSTPEPKLFKKEVHDIYCLASPFTTIGKNVVLFSCKQEVLGDQHDGLSINNYPPTPPTFFQLPHLESTEKISTPHFRTIDSIVNNPLISTTYSSNRNERRGGTDGNYKVHCPLQCAQNFELGGGTITPYPGKAYFMAEESPPHCIDSNISCSSGQHLPENNSCWTLYENFTRLQGIEAMANLSNDQLFPHHFNGVNHLSRAQGTPNENYPSGYEIELWNFPR